MTFRNKLKITEVITQVIETLQYKYTSFSIRKITEHYIIKYISRIFLITISKISAAE